MIKKIIFGLLSILIVFLLVGCKQEIVGEDGEPYGSVQEEDEEIVDEEIIEEEDLTLYINETYINETITKGNETGEVVLVKKLVRKVFPNVIATFEEKGYICDEPITATVTTEVDVNGTMETVTEEVVMNTMVYCYEMVEE